MAWAQLKSIINSSIKANNNQEITGTVLNNILTSIVNEVGKYATFAGVAMPSTNPGVFEGPIVYFSSTYGTYPNFDNITVNANELVMLYNLNGYWNKALIGRIFTQADTSDIADEAVTTIKLADGSVTTLKLTNGAVTTLKLADGSVTTMKLADLAVTTDKIENGAVTSEKIANGAITSAKMAAGAIHAIDIADDAITSNKLADDAVLEQHIKNGAIKTSKIGSGEVKSANIADGAITSAKIADGAINTVDIADKAVTSDKLATEAIGSDNIATHAITTSKLADKSITSDKLHDEAISQAMINAVNAVQLNLDKETNNRNGAIAAEAAERKADVNGLAAALASETVKREQGYENLNAAIEAEAAALGSETIHREQADEAESNRAQAKEQELSLAIVAEQERAEMAEQANARGIIYDVSANNDGAVFESLSALLSNSDLSTLIPISVRYEGMTIRFIQSSNNKYVQYRYMDTATTGTLNPFLDTDNWISGDGKFLTGEKVSEVGIDDEPTVGSDNLVKSGGVKREEYNNNNKFLLLDSGTAQIDITNDLIKNSGYVRTNGVVSPAIEYFFTQPFFLKKGCTITWYVIAKSTAVLSTTQSASINIGDNVNVVSTQTYYGTYTAEEDIYVVLSGANNTLKNVTISDCISEYNIRKNNELHNNIGGQIIHYNAIPKTTTRFELYDYIPKGREYTIKYADAYSIYAYFSDNTYELIRGDVSTDITASATKDIVAFQVSYDSSKGVLTNVFNVTSVAPVPEDYSSDITVLNDKIAVLDDKVETLRDSYFGENAEYFNAIPTVAYNNLLSVIPAGTKYHIHFPQNKALYEYYEGGDYSIIRSTGSSDDVDVIARGNVNRIYVESGQPKPSVKMEVTSKVTKGTLEEVEELKDKTEELKYKTEELEEKVNSTYIASNLFIGSLYNEGVKRKMVSLCAVPYYGCTLTFTLPEGISAGIISGVSNDYAADAGVTLSNGGSFTFNIAHNYYRIYFTGASLETINTYIADGDISVTFDAENNIVSEQQGCDSYIKSICYDFTSKAKNNKMYSMPILCHISDTHGDAMRMKRCIKYCEYLGGVDAVLHSGDAVAWNNTSKMTYVDDVAKDSSIVVLPCIGNHEAMSATAQDLYDDMSYLMTKNNVVTDSNTDVPTYYYKDIAEKKLRIICLNQFFADGRHYTQYELNFFVNALLTTPNEYGVIVMAHSPEGKPTRDNNHSAFYRDVTVGEGFVQLVGYAKPIQEIVDAFISRITLTKTYTQKNGNETETLTVNADFTNIDNSIDFIAHITGHEHEDCIGYNEGTTNKQLMLNITCGVGIMGGSVELANSSDLGRDGKGQSQDAFNIYAIDRVNGTVRIARVGANINNQMKERRYMIIPYKD